MWKAWFIVISSAILFSVVSGQDAWLDVINGGEQPQQQQQPIVPQRPLVPQQPLLPQRSIVPQQPMKPARQRQPQVAERRREDSTSPQNSIPPNRQPIRPPPRANRPPVRQLPGRRQPPKQQKKGGIIKGITDTISGAVGEIGCSAQGLYADNKLEDPAFINYQLQCLLERGECDEIGSLVKRMAPDIIRGQCPPPCDPCKKKQIKKVMATLSSKYPKQFQTMIQRFGSQKRG